MVLNVWVYSRKTKLFSYSEWPIWQAKCKSDRWSWCWINHSHWKGSSDRFQGHGRLLAFVLFTQENGGDSRPAAECPKEFTPSHDGSSHDIALTYKTVPTIPRMLFVNVFRTGPNPWMNPEIHLECYNQHRSILTTTKERQDDSLNAPFWGEPLARWLTYLWEAPHPILPLPIQFPANAQPGKQQVIA